MKVSIPTKQEMELTPPLFWKDPTWVSDRYIGFLDDKTAVKLYVNDEFISITNNTPEKMLDEIIIAQTEWSPVDESEFMMVYNEAHDSIRLTPREITTNNLYDREAYDNLKNSISY
jgi:predicted nucleic acid-binding protein